MINKVNGTGLKRIIKATMCSFKGFKAAWGHEAAFRQEVALVAILFPFSFYISSNASQLFLLLGSLMFLLFAEIVNSAIEALADKITTEYDELIGRAKDLGSAAVFLAFVLMASIWLHAFYHKINNSL